MSLDEVPEIDVIVEGCRVIVTSEGIVFTGPPPIQDDAVETLRETLKAYVTLGIRAGELEDEVKRLREALSQVRRRMQTVAAVTETCTKFIDETDWATFND